MTSIAEAVKRQIEEEQQISQQAFMNTLVMHLLPSSQLDQLPLQTISINHSRIPALILKDDTFWGVRQQVGLELPSDIDRYFNRPLLLYRTMRLFDKTDRPFIYIWCRDLWRLYRIDPTSVRGQIIGNIFRSISLLPTKRKHRLDDELLRMAEFLM